MSSSSTHRMRPWTSCPDMPISWHATSASYVSASATNCCRSLTSTCVWASWVRRRASCMQCATRLRMRCMAARARRRARTFAVSRTWGVAQAPEQKPLLVATDHGHPVVISPRFFAPKQERGGWGPAADTFLRMNQNAFATLDVRPEITARPSGPEVRIVPGGSAGAIPLRAAHTGHVVGGLVVRPRFGWAGVGHVLTETGWHAAPEFADLPLVPGSGREVPPWVLAGPVLARLGELLRHLRRGYRVVEATLTRPRGRILWR